MISKLLKINYHRNYALFACEGKQRSRSQKRPFHILFNEVAVMDGGIAWPIGKTDFFPFLINNIFAFVSELQMYYKSVSSHQFEESAKTISDGKAQGCVCSCFHFKEFQGVS